LHCRAVKKKTTFFEQGGFFVIILLTMNNLYFVRHGESEANANKTLAGWTDSPLTKKGIRQAEDLGQDLSGKQMKFDHIISSPSRRAYDTAATIAKATGFPLDKIVVKKTVMERCGGQLEGRSREVARSYSEADAVMLGAESVDTFAARVRKFINETESLQGDIILVSHSGFGKMLDVLLQGKQPVKLFEHNGFKNAKLYNLRSVMEEIQKL
jgi:broad specificity phosphatase PhoE